MIVRIDADAADRIGTVAVEDRRPGNAGVRSLSLMRPDINAGPMFLNFRPAKVAAVNRLSGFSFSCAMLTTENRMSRVKRIAITFLIPPSSKTEKICCGGRRKSAALI